MEGPWHYALHTCPPPWQCIQVAVKAEIFIAAATLQVWLVMADCCLIGLQPVLVHLSKNSKDGYSYHPISVNFLMEAVRIVFAIGMLAAYVRPHTHPKH